jgi:hypothetical protein
MDKAEASAREHIAATADLVGAVRLPEGSFRADAGTDVGIDILFFRKRRDGDASGDDTWLDLAEIHPATEGAIRVNRYFAERPEMVLGEHALGSGPYGETYTCVPRPTVVLEDALTAAILRLPDAIYDGDPETITLDDQKTPADAAQRAGGAVREGSYFIGKNTALMQMVDGTAVIIAVEEGEECRRRLRQACADHPQADPDPRRRSRDP